MNGILACRNDPTPEAPVKFLKIEIRTAAFIFSMPFPTNCMVESGSVELTVNDLKWQLRFQDKGRTGMSSPCKKSATGRR